MRAVRYDEYGGVDVLHVDEVPVPEPGAGEVLVKVVVAGINPGEAYVREGRYAQRWPSAFPSGQGSDLAGTVTALGAGVHAVALGHEVIGWTDERASQAEYVIVAAGHLLPRPADVPWEVAGSLHVVGATAWAAVRAVDPRPGETVVVSGAAGGVGVLAVQLARRAGATVVGIASEANHDWLRAHGVVPVAHDGLAPSALAERIRAAAPAGVDAFVDLFGGGYVDLAIELAVAPDRIDTIIDFDAVERHGVKADGNAVGARPEVLSELAALLAKGELELPVAATYPLEQVQDAYRDLERRHTRGKIVLVP
jgi:NADPH:quinone reductase-like Zn-dependent oxidoreductase